MAGTQARPAGAGAPTAAPERDPSQEVAARLPVTDRRGWLALAGVALLVVGALVWAVLGRAPSTVTGRGMVVPEQGFVDIGAAAVGTVLEVLVAPGDLVAGGAPVARVRVATGGDVTIDSPVAGRIATVVARAGGRTEPGVPLATVEPSSSRPFAVGFLPAGAGKRIEPGMAALVAPDSVPRSQYGMVRGVVAAVSPLPATPARVLLLVGGNESLADYYLANGPVLEVRVALEADPASPSGLSWTVGSGPDAAISVGTLCDVSVVLADSSPLSRIVP